MDIIIGAGITGLSYALFSNSTDYLVLEKETEVGGYCRTIRRNGFVWDYSGHFFHFLDQNIKNLVLSGISPEELVCVTKNTRIKYKDLLVDYPFQKNIHQLSKEELLDCLYDLFSARDANYSNFQEMLYYKFGRSITEKFLVPYNEKLYACNLNNLDKDAMGRFFPYAEKEDIIRNFKAGNNSSYNNTFIYPSQGAFEYVNSIYNHLDKTKIQLKCEIEHISMENHTVTLKNGNIFYYDRLISTIPFPALLNKIGYNYNPKVYSWNQVLVFNLGFDKKGENRTDHWLYFPEKKYCFYRVGFYDNILNQDRMSLYVELSFSQETNIHPQEWLGQTLSDLKLAGILSDEQVLIDYESIIMNPAYVHINSHSIKDVEEKKQILAQSNIFSIGRYGSWVYCSIEDNIKEAQALANRI